MKLSTSLSNKTFTRIKKSCLILLAAGASIFATQSAYSGGDHKHSRDKTGQTHDYHEQRSHRGHENHASRVGSPASLADATKTIQVTMYDSMKFTFNEELDLQPGEVVRFVVTNKGKLTHEFSIGNTEEQRKHAKMMREMPSMKHADGNTISLAGGEKGELIWQFMGSDEIIFACNIPGHFEAGMFAKTQLNKQNDQHSH